MVQFGSRRSPVADSRVRLRIYVSVCVCVFVSRPIVCLVCVFVFDVREIFIESGGRVVEY